jgi:hypothetical protein
MYDLPHLGYWRAVLLSGALRAVGISLGTHRLA